MGILKSLFSSDGGQPGRLLPRDAAAILESFGRFEGPAPGGDVAGGIKLVPVVKQALEADPDRALDELVTACDSTGGWSYYGAWDILSNCAPDREHDPRYVHIVDGLLDTLHREGFGDDYIPMGLKARAIERQGAE